MIITPQCHGGLALQLNGHRDHIGKPVCSAALPGMQTFTSWILTLGCCFYEWPFWTTAFFATCQVFLSGCTSTNSGHTATSQVLSCAIGYRHSMRGLKHMGTIVQLISHALKVGYILNTDFAGHALQFHLHVHNSSHASGIHQAPGTCKHIWAVLVWKRITGVEYAELKRRWSFSDFVGLTSRMSSTCL